MPAQTGLDSEAKTARGAGRVGGRACFGSEHKNRAGATDEYILHFRNNTHIYFVQTSSNAIKMNTISPLAVQGQGSDSVVTRWLYKIAASGGAWSGVATTILNMSGYAITNVGSITSSGNLTISTPGGQTILSNTNLYIPNGNLNMDNNSVGGVNRLVFNSGGEIDDDSGNMKLIGNLNMNSNIISNVGTTFTFANTCRMAAYTPGGFSYPFYDINAPGGDGAIRLLCGTASVNLRGNGNLELQPPSGSSVYMHGGLYRDLGSNQVLEPVIQYGTATGTGTSGTAVVTIPAAYTSSSSYVVQVTMRDAPTAQLYANPTAANAFTIGWSSAGSGTQHIMWTSFGT